MTETMTSVATALDQYGVGGFIAAKIVEEGEIGGVAKYAVYARNYFDYFDAVHTAYLIANNNAYGSEVKSAAYAIIAMSVMGQYINLQGAIGSLQDAADILKAYDTQLSDLATQFPQLVSYDGGSHTISFPWNPANLPIEQFTPPDTHVPLSLPAPSESRPLPDWMDDPYGLFGDAPNLSSPLVLDLDSDGVELTAFDADTTRTFFDLDGNGFAEQTAWVSPDDGLLVRDTNENGGIDDINELFGSPTIDGFAKLALLDSNGDAVINQYDDAWNSLRVWQDANGDAVTQEGELLTLDSLDIVRINLAGIAGSNSTINGNSILQTSTFTYENGSTDDIVDAWFVHDNVNSVFVGDVDINPDTLLLPTLRGFGQLADLPIAMSQNQDLLNLVDDFAGNFDLSAFADAGALDDAIAEILYEWGGVADVDPGSRGENIDARKLEFMEKVFAQEFLQYGFLPNPYEHAGAELNLAWSQMAGTMKAQLIIQLGGAVLFDDAVTYDPASGELTGTFDLSQAAIGDLVNFATAGGVDTEAYWFQIVEFLANVKGLDNITGTEEGWLDTAIYDSGLTTDTWDDIVVGWESLGSNGGLFDPGTSGNDTITGSSGEDEFYGDQGNDTITGEGADDYIEGNSGNDTIDGGAGNDEILGGAGNDTITGGAGGDIVYGGSDDDTYIYTSGNDVYSEFAEDGADNIVLPSGIELGDITVYRNAGDSLSIDIGTLGSIEIPYFFTGNEIETVTFCDTSTLDLTTLTTLNFYGTPGADSLTGENAIDETIYGYAGDDTLVGKDGNDTLDGGAGNDTLAGDYGDDTYIFSAGFDTIWEGMLGGGGDYGEDIIVIPEGFTADDLLILKDGTSDVKLLIDNLGETLITGQLGGGTWTIEHIYFAENSTTVDFEDLNIEVRGTDGNDYLAGTTSGVSPNDTLNGLEGDDVLAGDTGDDTYVFSEGIDTISDTSGSADRILFLDGWGTANVSIFRGADGMNYDFGDLVLKDTNGNTIVMQNQFDSGSPGERIESVEFADSTIWDLTTMDVEVWGGSGNDNLNLGENDVTVRGFAGADYIGTGSGNEVLDGGNGDDTLVGGSGDDYYIYNAGLDIVTDSSGTDTLLIMGGATINDVSFSVVNTYDLKITLNAGTNEVTLDDFLSGYAIEKLAFDDGFEVDPAGYAGWTNGTSGNNTLTGNSSDNVIIGFAGNDTLSGSGGADHIHGGSGTDTLDGGTGADMLNGGSGDDSIKGGTGNDTIDGDDGTDTADYSSDSAGVTVNLATGTATDGNGDTDTLRDIENVTGSASADTITGSSVANTLNGGNGNDTIKGGGGNDTMDGGSGTDTVDYGSAAGGVTVSLASGTASNDGDGGSDTLSNFETVTGSAFGDTITGSSSTDTLNGGDGDDVIQGGAGNDTINGGNGTDTVSYSGSGSAITVNIGTGSATGDGTDTLSNLENVIGSSSGDTITGSSGANILSGGGGNDTIAGGDGNDTLKGGAGTDSLDGGNGTDTVDYSGAAGAVTVSLTGGTASNDGDGGSDSSITNMENVTGSAYGDTITGSSGANVLNGGAGNDTISGAAAADTLNGGDGNDTLDGGTGDDALDGGAGDDTVTYAAAGSGITVSLASGTATGDGSDTLTGIENVIGSANADTITGTSGANVLSGGAGADNISGGDGNDTLKGGAGNDTLNGGNDIDTVDYSSAAGAVTANLGSGTASNDGDSGSDTVSNIENVIGSNGADTITGSSDNNVLTGGAGADTISGGDGNDTLKGGAGNDTMDGGNGTGDTADYSSAAGAVTVNLGSGTASNDGDGGSDTLSNIENVIGSSGADTITGSTAANVLTGGAGADSLSGGDGNDRLIGGAGNDTINGGNDTDTVDYFSAAGAVTVNLGSGTASNDGDGGSDTISNVENANGSVNADTITGSSGANVLSGGDGADVVHGGSGADLLVGGAGADILYGDDGLDTLYGGSGADTFMLEAAEAFNNIDVIGDFNIANDNDALNISDILDATAYNHGVDAITDWVQITTSGSDSIVSIDRDGTGGSYTMTQVAMLQGITGLTDEAALVVSGNLIAA